MSPATARARDAKATLYRTLVVDAAERLLAHRGYAGTRIQDVAAEAGLSLGTLYSVFGGKDAIVEAIHHDRLQELFVLVGDAMGAPSSAADKLLLGNRVFIRWLTEHPDFLRLHLVDSSWASSPSRASSGQRDAWRRGVELIASVITVAIDEGDVAPGDPVLLARILVAIQQVFMSQWVELGMTQDADTLCDSIESQIRRSLFRSPS